MDGDRKEVFDKMSKICYDIHDLLEDALETPQLKITILNSVLCIYAAMLSPEDKRMVKQQINHTLMKLLNETFEDVEDFRSFVKEKIEETKE